MAVQDSPYWQPIVADDWPTIEPGEWTGLAELARDAAAAMRDGDIAAARRQFDEVVVSSAGLAPVRDAMAKDGGGETDFAAALLAAADVFAANAETVRRTRHRILDIVDRTERRIDAAQRNTSESQPGEPTPAPPPRVLSLRSGSPLQSYAISRPPGRLQSGLSSEFQQEQVRPTR